MCWPYCVQVKPRETKNKVRKGEKNKQTKVLCETNHKLYTSLESRQKDLKFQITSMLTSAENGTPEERNLKEEQKVHSMNSDRWAVSRLHLSSVCCFWQSIDSTLLSEVSN